MSKQNKFFDKKESELSNYIEKNDLPVLKNQKKQKMIDMLAGAAKNSLAKKKTISLRLPERDLRKLKAKAAQEGMPYQTLITSILHKNI